MDLGSLALFWNADINISFLWVHCKWGAVVPFIIILLPFHCARLLVELVETQTCQIRAMRCTIPAHELHGWVLLIDMIHNHRIHFLSVHIFL